MKCKLSDICDYAKDKIYVSVLDENTYISTENMMPNKGGITKASTLPAILQTQSFSIGDVLVSNIRPYFKKIWLAEYNGCSNDVLVFRARNGVSNRFLYYVLADDAFFDYSMTTSKGTKMPRGDKDAIMKYDVPNFKYEEQEKIAAILGALDDKIELNQKINDNLELQAQALFQHMFIDNHSSEWVEGKLSDIADIIPRLRVSTAKPRFIYRLIHIFSTVIKIYYSIRALKCANINYWIICYFCGQRWRLTSIINYSN